MEIHSNRFDVSDPFARQQQLAQAVRQALTRLPPDARARLLAQAMSDISLPLGAQQHVQSYLVPQTTMQAQSTTMRPISPVAIRRLRRVAQPLSWQWALVLRGIGLLRRIRKVWAREMRDVKNELRWLQRQLLRALARRWGPQGASAGGRRVLPGHQAIRGARARHWPSVRP